jgi:hypothetical protein
LSPEVEVEAEPSRFLILLNSGLGLYAVSVQFVLLLTNPPHAPVQLSEMLWGLKVSGLSVIFSVPGRGPALAGEHVTKAVQLENAAIEAPQVVLVILKVGDPAPIAGAGLRLIETL